MDEFKIGDIVWINIRKGGYWVDTKKGRVTKVTEKRVRVKTMFNERFYSPRSVDHAQ